MPTAKGICLVRSTRMFEIIQLLRAASKPLRAQDIARVLEVTKRTIYRDIASLQAVRVPIDGAAGVGYIMRPGFDLPPINFDIEEAEAVTVGLGMISRTGDEGLQKAARRAAQKISDATPLSEILYTSSWGPEAPVDVDLSLIREAIRDERKISIRYEDVEYDITQRTIMPIALIYYSEAIVVAAWCELRDDFRHFRPDRMQGYEILAERFLGKGRALRQEWAKIFAQDL